VGKPAAGTEPGLWSASANNIQALLNERLKKPAHCREVLQKMAFGRFSALMVFGVILVCHPEFSAGNQP
jgi:hypothetical protein